jgi:ankyrin repeat protein
MLSPASVSPKYFSTGFPYEKDEYLSYAGSCWAVMALVNALPRSAPAPEPAGGAPAEPTWIRTALFGTSEQLAGLLDQGMDANRKTERGTTLLMMAAPEAGKVRLLLSRGADPSSDAVTIAAAYRGTAQSIQALLDAGAAVEPPQGKRATRLPLVFASMSGDLENVKLLLERGADPARAAGGNAPLPQAVTFGYPAVVRALIDAGAPAKITESSGINLLHWAVIAHRPEVIPALVKAGAAVNATDENGYTPLMYAATIDFGDPDSIRALRAAGASLKIPNVEGRTPIQQARFYRHSALEAALR